GMRMKSRVWLNRCVGERSGERQQHDRSLFTVHRSLPRSGFTLIEILVVITVIAILASLVAPEVFRNVGDARSTEAKAQMESFALALDTYRLDNLDYPSTAQGLVSLVQAPTGPPMPVNWRGPYLRRGVPNDPWGRPYIYRKPGTANPNSYDLLSYGRDGVAGGTGEDADLLSWDSTVVKR
ncbi:MAG: type II secretion system major pseudopilin GspG, partial [Gemmatimonadales bacterium]